MSNNLETKNSELKSVETETESSIDLTKLLITFATGLIMWFIPNPEGLNPAAWQVFSIFVATIVGFIIKPLPMGAIAIVGMTATGLLTELGINDVLSGFSSSTIWLIVIAFFISRGFIKTGLGARVAYMFMNKFGKSTLGLSYSLIASDLVLAPAIPSNTSRGAGVIFPIIRSVCDTYGSRPEDGTEGKVGSFLMTASFQGNLITSAMFMTAMAANPLIVKLAAEVADLNITWTGWFTAALVPGVVSLIVIPYVIYKIYPPEVKETPNAAKLANEKLNEMGALEISEKYMLAVFVLILTLWIFGFGLSGTLVAFIGLSILLLTNVLTWEDIKNEKGAWNTLVWFAGLVMMASYLNELGMVNWFSDLMRGAAGGMSGMVALFVLAIVYYYSHYFFASMTAHISAMYAAFLAVTIAVGAPPMLAALVLAFFSNLFAATTHYGTGPAPVFFGAGYVPQKTWWKIGFIISLVQISIWSVVGGLWWKVLGLW